MLFRQLALVAAAAASPLEKRLLNANDQITLNTLLYLENLQSALYTIGCINFTDSEYGKSGYPVGFRQNICYAAQQGQVHAATVQAGLTQNGAAYVRPCTYRFDTVTDPSSFVALAIVVNTVIESAYLGAAEYLADAPGTDEVVESIAVVKARQGGFLRSFSGLVPFPATFDTGISQAYANHLVNQFITTCPTGSRLPVSSFPNLNITGLAGSQLATLSSAIGGTTLKLTFPSNILAPFSSLLASLGLTSPLYVAFITQNIFSPTYVAVTKTSSTTGTVVFPKGVQGVVYLVLTPFSGVGASALSMDDLSAGGTAAGPVAVLVS